ncbi:MAG: nucleotidyltransferase family protein [Bacteroidetes bacterium]|nr:nucleotidyltransferase family protein [Bacteroidota bacterium]
MTSPRKAMIFAAGLGTRLQPLTHEKPKALATINGYTLLEILIRKLIRYQFNHIIVNVHHFAGQIIDFLKQKQNFAVDIHISDESGQLLDTGGGIVKASWFLDDVDSFLVHNVDVITDMDLHRMENFHLRKKALATLAVRNRPSSRYLLFDDSNKLCGWMNTKTGEKIMAREESGLKALAFSGIHFINAGIFQHLKRKGRFSIIEAYLELARQYPICGYQHDDGYWLDVGRPENIRQAEKDFSNLFPGL